MVILFVFSVVAAIINVCFQNFSSANAQGVTTESGSISAKSCVLTTFTGGSHDTCTSTVSWTSNSETACVYANGHLFACGMSGSQPAPWIHSSGDTFSLYSDKSTASTLLASVTVIAQDLGDYWPITPTGPTKSKSWNVVWADNTSNLDMTITNKSTEGTGYAGIPGTVSSKAEFDQWYTNHEGLKPPNYHIERYRFCAGTPGGSPWLFFDKFMNTNSEDPNATSPSNNIAVGSSKILVTYLDDGSVHDLIADGTYATCGSTGQPYLSWLLNRDYRIQVWGYLINPDTGEKKDETWYWDATVMSPKPITNQCLSPALTINTITVQEAYWSSWSSGWSLGSGDIVNGQPTGYSDNGKGPVVYGRTDWHAEQHMPYFLLGPPGATNYSKCEY